MFYDSLICQDKTAASESLMPAAGRGVLLLSPTMTGNHEWETAETLQRSERLFPAHMRMGHYSCSELKGIPWSEQVLHTSSAAISPDIGKSPAAYMELLP